MYNRTTIALEIQLMPVQRTTYKNQNSNKREAEYYLFGIKMSKDEWLERKADVNGIPWYKTAAGKQSGARV